MIDRASESRFPVPEPPGQLPGAELEVLTTAREGLSWPANIAMTGALAATAYVAYKAESFGSKELIHPFDWVATSMAHPVLGYAGGLLAAAAAKIPFDRLAIGKLRERLQSVRAKTYGALAVSTTVAFDAIAEVHQSQATNWAYDPLAGPNRLETGKDLLFAGLGLGLFHYLNRRRAKVEQAATNREDR